MYKEKDVRGLVVSANDMKIHPCNITVRMTSDKRGKSLSLQGLNVMVQIPLEGVEDVIKAVE